MYKPLIAALVSLCLIGASATAQAGGNDRHHGGYDYGYGYPYHDRYDDDDGEKFAKFAAGAIILGTIIYAINQNQRQAAVVEPQAAAPLPDYWYRIDGEGRCVEVRLNSVGREVWTYVPQNYCE